MARSSREEPQEELACVMRRAHLSVRAIMKGCVVSGPPCALAVVQYRNHSSEDQLRNIRMLLWALALLDHRNRLTGRITGP